MLYGFATLLSCQLAGEVFVRALSLAVPGPVVGASHGIGTARAFQIDPLAGTFAGIALGLNGLVTALLVPILLPLLVK